MKIRLRVDDLESRIRLKVPRDASIAVSSSYVSGGGTVYPVYEGDYTSVPKWERQVYDTKSRLMTYDFTVENIREYEVANDAGGLTLTI